MTATEQSRRLAGIGSTVMDEETKAALEAQRVAFEERLQSLQESHEQAILDMQTRHDATIKAQRQRFDTKLSQVKQGLEAEPLDWNNPQFKLDFDQAVINAKHAQSHPNEAAMAHYKLAKNKVLGYASTQAEQAAIVDKLAKSLK